MSSPEQNRAASVRASLLRLAHETGENFQALLVRYATERLIYRLGQSEWSERFVLKGAWLFQAWEIPRRSTRDVDFLAYGDPTAAEITQVFARVVQEAVEDDGVVFDPNGIRIQETRGGAAYPGLRLRIPGRLSGARFVVQIDLGFGDAIVREPVWVRLPTLLDAPPPEIRAYSFEVAIAEKTEAIVRFGTANSRYKDFYDLAVLASEVELSGPALSTQLVATFARRGNAMPTELPEPLRSDFATDPDRLLEWQAFLSRSEAVEQPSLAEAIAAIRALLRPVFESIINDQDFPYDWTPDHGWSPA